MRHLRSVVFPLLRSLTIAVPATILGAIAGCGPYTIHGRAVEGDASYVALVNADDPRLEGKGGVSGVAVRLQLEPARLNRRIVAQEFSDADGRFTLPVDEFGAGVTNLESALLARRRGYQSAEGVFNLPVGSKRVLVVLAPGPDTSGAHDAEPTPIEQYERFR